MVGEEMHKGVMQAAKYWAGECHPDVAARHAQNLARYARLSAACAALESFVGLRPRDDDDLFEALARRRQAIADQLAQENLAAYAAGAAPGLYLAIPFFTRCSDRQPVWLLNRSDKPLTYLGRKTSAFASVDDGIEYHDREGSAFADRIADQATVQPGEQLKIDDYSMSFDGDFIGTHRVVLLCEGQRSEWHTVIPKLAGYLYNELHGLHRLEPSA